MIFSSFFFLYQSFWHSVELSGVFSLLYFLISDIGVSLVLLAISKYQISKPSFLSSVVYTILFFPRQFSCVFSCNLLDLSGSLSGSL